MSPTPLRLAALLLTITVAMELPAQTGQPRPATRSTTSRDTRSQRDDTPRNALSPEEWRSVDKAVDHGLAFLASQQQGDGSFPSLPNAQPGVTSLCVLAFMAHGHNPGSGPYGERLDRAVQYIADCQKLSGTIMLLGSDTAEVDRNVAHEIGAAGTYNHAISSLTLCELYGMNPARQSLRLKGVIEKALRVTLLMQHWQKDQPKDEGGWRYINDHDQSDSDLSVTGWHLMFLRSARNAGFRVPEQTVNNAVAYVRRTFSRSFGTFMYTIDRGDVRSRGMTGAGILALGHAGFHNSTEARRAAEDLMGYSFDVYNDGGGFQRDRYHYSLFMCCQGMYQMGSPYWEQFFPRTIRAVLTHQMPDGSWDAESYHRDRQYGNCYTTSLAVLALGAPNQLLPIFQR